MGKKDPRIDNYISNALPFARPLLSHLRKLVHQACPDVEETIKWGMPSFDYKGPYCSMASFKQHCAFGFWKASLMDSELRENQKSSMGHLGKITSLEDLPSDKILLSYLAEAKRLNDEGIKLPARKPVQKADVVVPQYFTKALKTNQKAYEAFKAFSPSHRKEYIEWITEAKTEVTRNKRMNTAIEWIVEGKGRNWKYMEKSKGKSQNPKV